jgi:hypothetical protein
MSSLVRVWRPPGIQEDSTKACGPAQWEGPDGLSQIVSGLSPTLASTMNFQNFQVARSDLERPT